MSKTYTYEDILARLEKSEMRLYELECRLNNLVEYVNTDKIMYYKSEEEIFSSLIYDLMVEKFNIVEFRPHIYKSIKNVGDIEIDALGVVNGDINSVHVSEIKSKFDKEAIPQLEKIMSKMNTFYPDLKDKKKFGIIAVPNLKSEHKTQIMNAGFIPVSLKDDLAIIKSPDDFVPKEF